MIRFGGPVFVTSAKAAGAGESHGAQTDDPALLARAHRAKGFTAAYAPRVTLSEPDKIRDIRKAFAAEGVMIAEVGYWENLMDTDPDTRRANRARMLDALALAEELGACCAVDIWGSYVHGKGDSSHRAGNFSEEAFDQAVETARWLIDSVKPRRTKFAYEIFPFNVVDSPEEMTRLIAAVDRPAFAVHMDLVNLVNCPRAYWRSGEIMQECVKLFGNRIVSAHAKDIRMKEPAISVILEEVIPGEGGLDIAANIRELHRLPHPVPYMMEHLSSEAEYDRASVHIRAVAKAEGISL